MKKLTRFLALALGLCMTIVTPSHAWTEQSNAKIAQILSWESNDRMHFLRSDGVWCYVPGADKLNQTLVLSIYVAGRTALIHCHDAAEHPNTGMPPAHKLHRIIVQ